MSRVSRRDLEAWAKRLITHEGMLRPLAREHGQLFKVREGQLHTREQMLEQIVHEHAQMVGELERDVSSLRAALENLRREYNELYPQVQNLCRKARNSRSATRE